jgi:hypothetical protein
MDQAAHTEGETQDRVPAAGGQLLVRSHRAGGGDQGNDQPAGPVRPPFEHAAQRHREREEQHAEHGGLAVVQAELEHPETDADVERQGVRERTVAVVAARVAAPLGQVVDAERQLLHALGEKQREHAERVRHGRATLVGGDPAGQVHVG